VIVAVVVAAALRVDFQEAAEAVSECPVAAAAGPGCLAEWRVDLAEWKVGLAEWKAEPGCPVEWLAAVEAAEAEKSRSLKRTPVSWVTS
jgi:hypothetical protein